MTTAKALEIMREAIRHGGHQVTVTQAEVDQAIVQIVCTYACPTCNSRVGQYCDAKGGLHVGRLWDAVELVEHPR